MHLRKSSLFLLAAVIIISCSPEREANTKDEHDHESSRQVTLFSENIEFFIEFPPLVSGHEEAFTIHLTRLDSYRPVSVGTVTLTLENPAGEITASSSEPIRDGIFRIAVTPIRPGFASIHFSLASEEFREKATAEKIRVYASKEDIHDHADDAGNEIAFSKENAWNADFMVRLVEPGPFSGIIKTGGEMLAIPGEKHHVHARSAGMVRFARENLVAGDDVQKGEKLVTVKGEGLAHENITFHHAEAETRFGKSRSDYERKSKLLAENAVSEKEFIESRTEYLIDSFYYYNVAQAYGDGGLIIRAPIDGYIHQLAVSEGEFIRAGQLIATISSNKRLLLRADVPQQYYKSIHNVVSTNFRPAYSPEVLDIETMDGKLLAIGSSVTENNHYLPVYFEARNNGDLLEGAFSEFYLRTSVVEDAITLPRTAILEEHGLYFVYVQLNGENYLKRAITIADSDGLKIRVEKGLSAGERVVTRGAMLLKTISVSTAIPAHNHEH